MSSFTGCPPEDPALARDAPLARKATCPQPNHQANQLRTEPTRIPPRDDRGTQPAPWRRPRVVLWTAAGVATLGFLVALEVVARGYGFSGPITEQSREVIFAPESGPLLYGGLALTMVVLTWRQRLIALGIAAGVDVAFFLVRWALDADMNFGNGALWVVLGVAVLGLTRRTGRERIYDGYPDVALQMVDSRTFDGRLQLLDYIPTVLEGPAGAAPDPAECPGGRCPAK